MRSGRRTLLRAGVSLGAAAALSGCLGLGTSPEEAFEAHADDLAAFSDVGAALDAGFRSRGAYVETTDGALGEVFVHERAHEVGSAEDLDPTAPTLLFAALDGDGEYTPRGIGWSIDADQVSGPPELFGESFHPPTDHHVPGQDNHFGLHAWAYDDSVGDLFRPLHPTLTPPPFLDTLHDARAALTAFQAREDQSGAELAEEAGYQRSEEHVFTDEGLYGVPYYDDSITELDPERPPILLYRMTELWYRELLGAEWFVPTDSRDQPPTLFDQTFHEPLPGHSSELDQPEHYGLHAWLFRANPNGMFARYNPRFE